MITFIFLLIVTIVILSALSFNVHKKEKQENNLSNEPLIITGENFYNK